jgi:hypothetical protein
MRMKRICLFLLCFLAFLSFLWSEEVSKATAKEKYRKFSIRFNFLGEPLLAGKAGSGSNPPGYGEAFRPGVGGGLEIGFSFHPRHQAFIGFEDKDHNGRVFEGVKFSKRQITLVYAGWKMNLLTTQESSLKPYLKVEVGAASLNKMEIVYHDIHNDYWDSSRVPMVRIGVGIELILFEWKPYSNGVFLEIKGQYLGKQPSLMSPHADSGGCWSLPISLGLSFNL